VETLTGKRRSLDSRSNSQKARSRGAARIEHWETIARVLRRANSMVHGDRRREETFRHISTKLETNAMKATSFTSDRGADQSQPRLKD